MRRLASPKLLLAVACSNGPPQAVPRESPAQPTATVTAPAPPPPTRPALDALLAELTRGCPDHALRQRWCAVADFNRGTHDSSLDGRSVAFGFSVWLSTDRSVDAALEHEALSAFVAEARDGAHVGRLAVLQGGSDLDPTVTVVKSMIELGNNGKIGIPHDQWATVDGWYGDAADSLVATPNGWAIPSWMPQMDLELRRVGTMLVAIGRSRTGSTTIYVAVLTDRVAGPRIEALDAR